MKIEVGLSGGDTLSFDTETHMVEVSGCLQLRERIKSLSLMNPNPVQWPLQLGSDHVSQMVNKMILLLKQEWSLPYNSHELCHCRQVTTETVEELIILGALSQQEVSQRSRAGTGCGTCRKHITQIIEYYKNKCQLKHS